MRHDKLRRTTSSAFGAYLKGDVLQTSALDRLCVPRLPRVSHHALGVSLANTRNNPAIELVLLVLRRNCIDSFAGSTCCALGGKAITIVMQRATCHMLHVALRDWRTMQCNIVCFAYCTMFAGAVALVFVATDACPQTRRMFPNVNGEFLRSLLRKTTMQRHGQSSPWRVYRCNVALVHE